ncbi:AbfB domain-containing protein [Actinoplanes sp. ATCC 53533]|uniref:AbfB domain-containing protein n=1 Tax=Actinoplanes sp. ATCC 53533 TaxID=1288362 RepID=UPI0013156F55|nr:AbfB domain-containing protein [Actinoplanes sp. ATCC 53533]
MSEEDGRPAHQQAGEWVPPPQYFAPAPRVSARVPMAVVTDPVAHRAYSPGRLRTVLVGGAVVSVLAAVGMAVTSGEEERPGPLFVALPSVPAVTVPPSGTPATEGPTGRSVPLPTSKVRETLPGPGGTAGTGTAGPGRPAPSASATPVVVLPVIGAVIGLEPVGEPGRRLRHRNFVARIDQLGADSPEGDRADSRFTVRAGRGDATCLSFEAANYPGYFLRARGFELRLERPSGWGGDQGFDAEATFCAVPAATGGFVLRSRSDQRRYVTERNSVLSLNEVVAAKAKAFVTRPPL